VTEAGRQGVPLGEVRAMTEHRSFGTVMGYFRGLIAQQSLHHAAKPEPKDAGDE
jgi:hypothetical protein